MLRLCTKILLCIGALFAAFPAQATIIRLEANLTRAQEGTPTSTTALLTGVGGVSRPEAFGNAIFFLDTTPGAEKMTMTVTVFNIDVANPSGVPNAISAPPAGGGQGTQTTPNVPFDDLVAAHIHVSPTPTPSPITATFPVRWGFWGSPYHNTDNDGTMVPFVSDVGGVFTAEWDRNEGAGAGLTEWIPQILAGNSYINYHTGQFGSGEIRGVLLAVPEPGSFALLGLGLVGLAGLRRRSA